MATIISHSPEETLALGEAWGRTAQSGLLVGLCGDLGAGKTQLVKGFALGLDITARVHSPTFALVNIYSGGRLTLFHLDLYRLETNEQILAAGFEEYLAPSGIAVVEWAERWDNLRGLKSKLPSRPNGSSGTAIARAGISIRLRWAELESSNETERRITYEDFGA
jgi:tRNA threonylcarbamoyladenosine biosynthesis protein TsaE